MQCISITRGFFGFLAAVLLSTSAQADSPRLAGAQHRDTLPVNAPYQNVDGEGGGSEAPRQPISPQETVQPALPLPEPDFGVFIDLQPVAPNAPAEATTRLIVYYRQDNGPNPSSAAPQSSDQSAARTSKEDPAEGGEDLLEVQRQQTPVTPENNSGNENTPDSNANELVRNDQLSVATEFGEGAPLTFPVPVTIAAATAYAAELERDPAVAAVLVDRRVSRHSISTNDSLNYVMWNLGTNTVGTAAVEPVWPQGQGSGLTVAVLDTGMVNHPDMVGVWSGGYDLITDPALSGDGDARDADPTDTMSCDEGSGFVLGNPHGLQVGSVIAARVNNSEGIAGVSPSASIQPVRVISSCGGWLSDVLDGMRWAVGLPVSGLPINPNPAKVLNLSLGTTSPGVACSPTVQSIVDEVRATGATIIVSTGNDGADAISVPAACSGVIAVTASTKFGNRASYANAGAGTTLAAPGGGCKTGSATSCFESAYNYVPVASHDGSTTNYVVSAGTSFAAPHVAGAAALLLERNPSRTPDDIASALVNSARPFAAGGCDNGLCGAGMLDVQASLSSQGYSVAAQASPSASRGGETVTLTATVSQGTNSPVFSWVQTSGTPVSISGANTAAATFVAPMAEETLSFTVTVTDTSGLVRIANASTVTSSAPVLAPLATVEVDPNAQLRQEVLLSDGSVPQAISVDQTAVANGVTVDANEVVWTVPASGYFTFVVTPFDDIGSGVSTELSVLVKGTDIAASSSEAGAGALGLHGAVLLLLAWFGRRRLLDARRDTSAIGAVLAATVIALYAVGYSGSVAPATATVNANLWLASFLHMNLSHLLINVAGLMLLGIAFAGRITVGAWAFALLVAAPYAHWAVTTAGLHPWVLGLSTALHAVVAWVAIGAIVQGHAERSRPLLKFGLLIAGGLLVKVLLDPVFVTHWDNAQTAPTLHLIAAAIAGGGALIVGCSGVADGLSRLAKVRQSNA